MRSRYADLHLHTTASDGTQDIATLIARAKARGLSTIAITDHDTISEDLTERVTEISGMEVISGVELKVDYDGVPGELLGYFIDPLSAPMRELFDFMRDARERRMEEMVKRCRERAKRTCRSVKCAAWPQGALAVLILPRSLSTRRR